MEDKITLTVNVRNGINSVSELMKCVDVERDKVIEVTKKKILDVNDFSKESPLETVVAVLQELSDKGMLNMIHLNYIFSDTPAMLGRALVELKKENKLISKEWKLFKNNENN